MAKTWIQTYTGRKLYPLNPDPKAFCWEDMAHALSNICRYTGHTRSFYSVAQHAVLVSRTARELGMKDCNLPPREKELLGMYCAQWGLIHDNSEAYLADIARPVKHQEIFIDYRLAEDVLSGAIGAWAGMGVKPPVFVKMADLAVYAAEVRDLMQPIHPEWERELEKIEPIRQKIRPLSPGKAKALYIKEAKRLGLWNRKSK